MFKYETLNAFIGQHRHLPAQGSAEWLKLRENFIGGSELSTILKKNKNKSVSKLVLEKLGFDKFQGNAITAWGNVFEEMIRQHCEEAFCCSIKETGSIPYRDGFLSYSPDGLAVVPTNVLKRHFTTLEDGVDESAAGQLVLFEFKCPHSRVPSHEIPEHYLPQVMVGMNIIDIMETAVFVQSVYRRCAFDQLKYDTSHNPCGHFKRADTSTNPVEYGFMIVYATEATGYSESLFSVIEDTTDASMIEVNGVEVPDLGSMRDSALFGEIICNVVSKEFKIDYAFRELYSQSIFEADDYKREMYDISIQYKIEKRLSERVEVLPNIIGVIPFKMMNLFITPVAKNQNYIQEMGAHEQAARVIGCINDHRNGSDDKATTAKSVRAYKL